MEGRAHGVLFEHTFEHRELGDHVDEIRFSEPVVMSSCDIKEFHATSFGDAPCGVELFAHVRGETRFERVCVYTPCASASLEVEMVATDHLVLRGVYSSLTLVIYGNRVGDLNLLEDPLESSTPAWRVPSGLNLLTKKAPEVVNLVWKVVLLARDSSSARQGLVAAALSLRGDRNEEELIFRSLSRVAEEAEKSCTSIDAVFETEALLQLLNWIEDSLPTSSQALHPADTLIAALAAVQLLCIDFNACLKFVVADGMQLLIKVLQTSSPDSMVVLTFALQALESSSRHPFACEQLIGDEKQKAKAGYAVVLSTLLRAPAASQVAFVTLQRLRAYELIVLFQAAVDSLLVEVSAGTENARVYLAKATKSLKLLTNVLHMKDTSSVCGSWFIEEERSDERSNNDEKYIMRILQERRVMSSLAAYISVPLLHGEDCTFELSKKVMAVVQFFLLFLVSSGYGTLLLAVESEATSLVMNALCGLQAPHEESTFSLRKATSLISKNVILPVQDIGHLVERTVFVVNAFEHLLLTSDGWQERSWWLSRLMKLCRTKSGREAILAVLQIEEVFSGLLETLASAAVETTDSLEVIHYVLEILHLLFTDSSLSAWKIWKMQTTRLQEIFRGLNVEIRETATLLTRLQLLVDVVVLYQSKGVTGLLKLAASTVGSELDSLQDTTTNSLPLKLFGLHDNLLLQVTSCMQLLASVCNPSIAAALIGEGAVALIAALLEDANMALQDELMAEYVTMEPTNVMSVLKLLVPTLLLLVSLFQRIQLEGRKYRNTKLVSVLLRLHRIVSGMPSTHTTGPPYSWQGGGGLEQSAVLRLTASCLAFWPAFGWEPAVEMFSSRSNGPIGTGSSLILLADLLPREPPPNPDTCTIFQDVSLEALLGRTVIPRASWHAQTSLKEPMLEALLPSIEQLSHVILRLAVSVSGLLIKLLKNVVIRISCASASHSAIVLRPLLTYIAEQVASTDMDHFRVNYYIKFLTELSSHPAAKAVLLQEEALKLLSQTLTRFARSSLTDDATSASLRCTLSFFVRICESSPHLNFQDCCTVASLFSGLSDVLPLETCFELLSDALTRFYSLRCSCAALIAVQLRLENTPTTRCSGDSIQPLLSLVFRRLCTALAAERNRSLVLRLVNSFAFGAVKLSAAGKSLLGMGALKVLFGMHAEDVQENVIREAISIIDEKHGDMPNGDDRTNSLETRNTLDVLQRLLQRPLQLQDVVNKVQAIVDGNSSWENPSDEATSPWIRLKPPAVTCEDLDLVNGTERAIESMFENGSSTYTWECSAELTVPTVRTKPSASSKRRRKKARCEQQEDQPEQAEQMELFFQVDDAVEDFNIEETSLSKDDDEDSFLVGRTHADSSELDYVPEKEAELTEAQQDPAPSSVTTYFPPMLQPLFQHSVFPPLPQPPVSALPFPLAVPMQHHLAPPFPLQLHHLPAQQVQYHLPHPIYQQPLPVLPPPQRRHETSSTLQQLLASPEALQELAQDQARLTRLLEEHPRLLTLLQERFNFG